MSDTLKLTILGCGSSGGVPRIGGDWGACDPDNPKNRRQRCSLLVERIGAGGTTSVLIDAGPDLRNQLLQADVGRLDAVLITHEHADHCHGLDDLRVVVFNRGSRLPIWAERRTLDILMSRFGYAFVQPPGSPYPPILEMNRIDAEAPLMIDGAGGPLSFEPIVVAHGTIPSLGFKVGDAVYIPDVSDIPKRAQAQVQGADLLILDCLRRKPHPSHLHLAKSLKWIETLGPQQAVLTNLHNDLDYDSLETETTDHITPAYDGLVLTQEIDG